jgi:hypothetical protein
MKDAEYREAIQNRTMEPSPDSWEKLNEKLNQHDRDKRRKLRPYLRYAAVVLLLVSSGLFLLKTDPEIKVAPVMEAPLTNDNNKPLQRAVENQKTEVVTTPVKSTTNDPIPDKAPIQPTDKSAAKEGIAFSTTDVDVNLAETIPVEQMSPDTLHQLLSISEDRYSEDAAIEDEIDRLLYESKMKLQAEGRMVPGKVVDANNLLSDIEDDLDKSLKEILFEKILQTVKNPKQVVTYQED